MRGWESEEESEKDSDGIDEGASEVSKYFLIFLSILRLLQSMMIQPAP